VTEALGSLADYEAFVYSLADLFPSVRQSTLQLIRRGATLARVVGEVHFDHGIRLIVRLPGGTASPIAVWRKGGVLFTRHRLQAASRPIVQARR
jgi:hypothetical protein